MKKRVLSLFLAFTLCFSMLPTAALAEEAGVVQDAANANSTHTTGEDAGLTGGKDGSVPDGTDGGDADSSGEAQDGEADTAVSAVQELIDALPDEVTAENAETVAEQLTAIDAALEALTAEQLTEVDLTHYEAVCAALTELSAVQEAHANHCVCGKDSGTTVNGHTTHNTGTTWTAADSLPGTAGSYYLTQSVSGDWTVPTGEVNLCLNGQTINGKITVGSGATLTLTDCTGTGKLQGSRSGSGVSINGGTFNLYGGTITGFVNGVEIGSHNDIKTGSSFTMYGGTITSNEAGSSAGGGVFLISTTNSNVTAPSFTMHGGTISNNTAGASDGGGGGVYVGEKCSFTMDGGTITGNTATAGNGGGIYIHYNAGIVSISNATITDNKASATGDTRYGHGGGIYSGRSVTVEDVTITGNNSTYEGGGIYGNGTINLTDATVTGNNQYDVYYGGEESTTPELTVSGSVKAGYYANNAWKLPIFVSDTLSDDSVIRVGVYKGIKPNAGGRLLIAEPASGVTLRAENFKADAADSVTSLGKDGKVYLSLCDHEMDDTGYTCKKCKTQFDARVGERAYYQTLAEAFLNAWNDSTITLMRDVNLNGNCSTSDTITLDLHGKTITSEDKPIRVNEKLTVKDSSEGGGRRALNVKFLVASNGTLAVDDSYTGDISCVELWPGGALEAYTGTIQELLLGKEGNGTGYSVKLWKDNTHCCTVKKITLAENADQALTVGNLLKTNHAKCELYGEKGGTWSVVPKTKKISELAGYTAYKVQFAECVHQCDDDTNPVCSKCGKALVVKITATASDGKIKTAWFPADSGIENGDGYVEAIQTLNGWSAEGYTDATLMPLCDVHNNTGGIGIASVTLTGKLTVDGGEHLIYSTTLAAGADVTFKTGRFYYITVNGKASFVGGTYLGSVTASSGAEAVFSGGAYQYLYVKDGGTAVVKNSAAFGEDVEVIKGTLTVEGGSFGAAVVVEGDGTMNVNGGSFTGTGLNKVTYSGGAKGTISGGSFADLYLYSSGAAWLAGGSFTKLSTASSGVLSSLLADGAAYYDQRGSAISGSGVSELNNVTVKTHAHTVDKETGICSTCGKQMAASLTVGNETSWYLTLDAAIKAANEGNGEKTLKLYQNVKTDAPSYELTRGPVTLDVNEKKALGTFTVKGIQLTVTGTGTIRDVTASGSSAVVKNSTVNINYIEAENGGRLELGGGSYMGLTVQNDGSSASLSGGTYKKIDWGKSYVPANEYLADGYGYKTSGGTWDDGIAGVDNVTVTPAPIKSTKVYPNMETGYSGSTFDAKDSTSVTLTVSVTPDESAGLTYIWCRSINDEWRWLTNPSITQDLTEKYTGADSKTLSITELPADQTFSYKVQIATSDGYKCFSKPFTVTRHQHSWTYTASGATITAKCSECQQTGGSVTLKAPDESTLTYDGNGKAATLDNKLTTGATVSASDISYHMGESLTGNLPAGNYPTDAGEYKASITVGGVTASVAYTIEKATPKAEDFIFAAPTSLTYDGNIKSPDIKWASGVSGMGKIGMCCYNEDGKFVLPKDAATYTVKINVAEGTNYKAASNLTDSSWTFTISRAKLTLNADDFTFKAMDELIYNGNPKTAEVTWKTAAKAMGFGAITVKYYDKDGKEVKEPKDAGTYTVKIDVAAGVGYEAQNDISSDSWTFTIAPVQQKLTFTSPAINKMYGDAAFTNPINEIGIQGTIAYTSSNANVATVDANGTVTILAASTEPVTITASTDGTDNCSSATASYTLTVAKKAISVSGITAANKTYDGKTTATLDCSKAVFAGKLENDTLTVTATGTFADKNAGENKTVTIADLTLDGASAGNYTLAASSQQRETSASITPATLTVTPDGSLHKTYGEADPALTYTYSGAASGETPAFRGKLARTEGENAGRYAITSGDLALADGEGFKAGNYTLAFSDTEVAFTIDKASWGNKTASGSARFGSSGTVDLSSMIAEGGSTVINAQTTDPNNVLYSYGIDGGTLSFAFVDDSSKVGATANIVVLVRYATNYEDYTITVTVTVDDKITPTLDGAVTLSPAKITYGEPLSTITITGTMKAGETTVEGTFAWQNPDTVLNAGTHSGIAWTFTPQDENAYAGASGTATVTVNKAAQSGTVRMASYTYGTAPSAPVLENRTGDRSADVSYYCAKAGSASTQEWNVSNPPELDAGTYRMYASIAETVNYYRGNADYCEFTVWKAAPTYGKPAGLTAKYGQTLDTVALVNPEGNTPGTWSWNTPETVLDQLGTLSYDANFQPDDTDNYLGVVGASIQVTVGPADGGSLGTGKLAQKYTDTSEHTYTPDWSGLPTGQTWSYGCESSSALLTKKDVAAENGTLTYAISGGKAGDVITITFRASCNNYADFTITLTITLTEKDNQQALRVTGGTTVVYGQTLTLSTSGGSGTGAVTYTVTNGTGEATIDPNGVLTPARVGSVTVTAAKEGDSEYNAVTSSPVEITITKATPTGTPKYTEITTSGKTLTDAALTVEGSTLKPNAGTLEWIDENGNALPGNTVIEANKTYKWRFTPTDGNYTVLTGSIELYHKSSSGGSGWYYTYYTIKATAGTNGSISPSGWTSVRDGRDQTFTITPDKGYAVAKVLVDGKSVGAVKSYTFKNVTKDHTIEAVFMRSNGNPQTGVFVDVPENSYYEEAVDWAVEKGITNGVSSNMFAPNDPCTRAQIVTFLWRAAGSPAPKSMSSFTDVPADAFYAKAVAWAVENGITSGTGESKFSPNSTCTRAQAVTFLYRASGSPAVSGKAEFSDVSTTAFYADAVAWAAKKGITTGIGGGLFGSDNDCTRGQIVTFLWRAMAE